jgi:hypothetical protein
VVLRGDGAACGRGYHTWLTVPQMSATDATIVGRWCFQWWSVILLHVVDGATNVGRGCYNSWSPVLQMLAADPTIAGRRCYVVGCC